MLATLTNLVKIVTMIQRSSKSRVKFLGCQAEATALHDTEVHTRPCEPLIYWLSNEGVHKWNGLRTKTSLLFFWQSSLHLHLKFLGMLFNNKLCILKLESKCVIVIIFCYFHVYGCTMCIQHLQKSENGIWSWRTGMRGSCWSPSECYKLNLGFYNESLYRINCI